MSQNNYLSKREVYAAWYMESKKDASSQNNYLSKREVYISIDAETNGLWGKPSQNNYLSKREVYEDKALTQEALECLKITTSQRERFI